MENKTNYNNFEIFTMNMPDVYILLVEQTAKKYQITMSWLYRSILYALLKKFPNGPDKIIIKRPNKFNSDFRKINICMYGDKTKWIILSKVWQVELGPLLRFGLNLYFQGKITPDFESVETVKQTKNHKKGKLLRKIKNSSIDSFLKTKIGCVCQYQNSAELYFASDYRPKNPQKNMLLLERGIKNRIYPLKPY